LEKKHGRPVGSSMAQNAVGAKINKIPVRTDTSTLPPDPTSILVQKIGVAPNTVAARTHPKSSTKITTPQTASSHRICDETGKGTHEEPSWPRQMKVHGGPESVHYRRALRRPVCLREFMQMALSGQNRQNRRVSSPFSVDPALKLAR